MPVEAAEATLGLQPGATLEQAGKPASVGVALIINTARVTVLHLPEKNGLSTRPSAPWQRRSTTELIRGTAPRAYGRSKAVSRFYDLVVSEVLDYPKGTSGSHWRGGGDACSYHDVPGLVAPGDVRGATRWLGVAMGCASTTDPGRVDQPVLG